MQVIRADAAKQQQQNAEEHQSMTAKAAEDMGNMRKDYMQKITQQVQNQRAAIGSLQARTSEAMLNLRKDVLAVASKDAETQVSAAQTTLRAETTSAVDQLRIESQEYATARVQEAVTLLREETTRADEKTQVELSAAITQQANAQSTAVEGLRAETAVSLKVLQQDVKQAQEQATKLAQTLQVEFQRREATNETHILALEETTRQLASVQQTQDTAVVSLEEKIASEAQAVKEDVKLQQQQADELELAVQALKQEAERMQQNQQRELEMLRQQVLDREQNEANTLLALQAHVSSFQVAKVRLNAIVLFLLL